MREKGRIEKREETELVVEGAGGARIKEKKVELSEKGNRAWRRS